MGIEVRLALALLLNSLPRPPILPPHSGHIQFKMPETTSEIVLTLLNLMNVIFASPVRNDCSMIAHCTSEKCICGSKTRSFSSGTIFSGEVELFWMKMKPALSEQHQDKKNQFAGRISAFAVLPPYNARSTAKALALANASCGISPPKVTPVEIRTSVN